MPSVAKAGTWDVSIAGWGPDWYGDAAPSFFLPLFYGKGGAAFPPNGSDFGFYDDPAVDSLVDQACRRRRDTAKARRCGPRPTSRSWTTRRSSRSRRTTSRPTTRQHVHNTVFIPAFQQIDPANVWLSK